MLNKKEIKNIYDLLLIDTFNIVNSTKDLDNYTCIKCKNIFKMSNINLINKKQPICRLCSLKLREDKQNIKELELKSNLFKKFGNKIKLLSFKLNYKKADFYCNSVSCNFTFNQQPKQLCNNLYGCDNCDKIQLDIRKKGKHSFNNDDLITLLYDSKLQIEILEEYTKLDIPFKVKCDCGLIWKTKISDLLTIGCPYCYKNKLYKSKKVSFNKKTVILYGYEQQALDFLIKKESRNKISVFSDGRVPIIEYRFLKTIRKFLPSFSINKTLYDVKSVVKLKQEWKRYIYKAKACIKQGYNYKIILIDNNNTFILNSNWLKHTEDYLDSFLFKQYYSNFTILSIDPGVQNSAWTIIKIDFNKPKQFKVITCGMFEHTIKDIRGQLNINHITSELNDLYVKYKPNVVIAERFMTRGHKGSIIEFVNIMLGIIINTIEYKYLLTAAQWKNMLNKKNSLTTIYDTYKLPDHVIDSIYIGIYGISKLLGKKPFFNLTKSNKKYLDKRLKKFEKYFFEKK